MFKLKNYTTNVPAGRSIQEVEILLQNFGACAVMKEYLTDGRVNSFCFKIGVKGFKLPVNAAGVEKLLYKGRSGRVDSSRSRQDQAYRVAWRILRDWLHAQLSLILSGQAEPEQVLLPYLWDGKRTLYEAYSGGLLALPGADEESLKLVEGGE